VVHPHWKARQCSAVSLRTARAERAERRDRTIRDEVVGRDLGEATGVGPGAEGTKEQDDTEVGGEDLAVVTLVKDDSRRREVVGPRGVVELAAGVAGEVHLPADELSIVRCQRQFEQSLARLKGAPDVPAGRSG
jgi:hypothetical protein